MSPRTTPALDLKRQAPSGLPSPKKYKAELSTYLGKCNRDGVCLLDLSGSECFSQSKRGNGELGPIHFQHREKYLLQQYQNHGAPVKLQTKPWSWARLLKSLHEGPH